MVSVVRGLNAAQKMLVVDGRKIELYFAVSRLLRLGEKYNHVGAILEVDEKQNSRPLVAKTSDFVFAGGMCLPGGYE